MSNDSTTKGYLLPVSTYVPEDDVLITELQNFVSLITNIPGNLVRPRWQAQPPNQPPATTNWVALGVIENEVAGFPVIQHDGTADNGQGLSRFTRPETLTVLISCYGPYARGNAALIRDSMYVRQNLDMLLPYGIELRGIDRPIVSTPELVNTQWINRADLQISFVRMVIRDYAIRNFNSAEVDLSIQSNDTAGTVEVLVNPPG